MDKTKLLLIKAQYESALFDDIIPFWEKHSIDDIHGGYLHCLDRDGSLLNDDKAVWLQGRECWLFARLYNDVKKDEKWLGYAKLGYEFLKAHCFDNRGKMYFSVTKSGKPLQMRRYFYSETFAIIAFAEYGKAAKDEEALTLARELFATILDYQKNPNNELLPPKINPNTRQLIAHGPLMITIATAQVLQECDGDKPIYQTAIDACMSEIFTKFLKPKLGVLLESVKPDGSIFNNPEGRTINPGHAIEASWFIMHEGLRKNNEEIINKALDIFKWSFERGWDKEYGGLFNFVDLDEKPSDKIEWDMKFWWPHNEALYASLLAYSITNEQYYFDIFNEVNEYSFNTFADPDYGEWFGYLHRDGSICLPVKGSMFKGAFHLPRQMLLSIKLLEDMTKI